MVTISQEKNVLHFYHFLSNKSDHSFEICEWKLCLSLLSDYKKENVHFGLRAWVCVLKHRINISYFSYQKSFPFEKQNKNKEALDCLKFLHHGRNLRAKLNTAVIQVKYRKYISNTYLVKNVKSNTIRLLNILFYYRCNWQRLRSTRASVQFD